MKYYFLTVVAVVAMSAQVVAQNMVHFGIKGGANLFDVYNDNGLNYDYKLGFHAGGVCHIHLSEHFALQPEVLYSKQGARFDFLGEDARLQLHYINVPVLAQYMFGNGFRIEAGPQVGFLADSGLKTDDYYFGNSSSLNTVDFAGAVGVSYVTKPGFGVDARYVHGFTDINDGGAFTSTNRGFQLGLFYLFGHR